MIELIQMFASEFVIEIVIVGLLLLLKFLWSIINIKDNIPQIIFIATLVSLFLAVALPSLVTWLLAFGLSSTTLWILFSN